MAKKKKKKTSKINKGNFHENAEIISIKFFVNSEEICV